MGAVVNLLVPTLLWVVVVAGLVEIVRSKARDTDPTQKGCSGKKTPGDLATRHFFGTVSRMRDRSTNGTDGTDF
jgi:hypothetical protein